MFAIATFCILFGMWIVMSGMFDLFHLVLGVLSSGLVAWLSHDLLFAERDKKLTARLVEAGRFCAYTVWLTWEILVANLHVTALALSPRAMQRIDPRLFTFRTRLKTDFARFILANSITLTPGTVTIRVHGDLFYIHAITPKAAGDLTSEAVGEMERRVAQIFEPESR